MNRWVEVGRLAYEHGARTCRVVNAKGKAHPACNGKYEQSHHGVFEAEKKHQEKEWRMFLDSAYNHCPACLPCNVQNRVGDPDEARHHYFLLQLKRYGAAQMCAWLNQAPKDIKERPLWRRCAKHLEMEAR